MIPQLSSDSFLRVVARLCSSGQGTTFVESIFLLFIQSSLAFFRLILSAIQFSHMCVTVCYVIYVIFLCKWSAVAYIFYVVLTTAYGRASTPQMLFDPSQTDYFSKHATLLLSEPRVKSYAWHLVWRDVIRWHWISVVERYLVNFYNDFFTASQQTI